MSIPNQNNQVVVKQNVIVQGARPSVNPIEMMRVLHLNQEQKSIRCSMICLIIFELVS